jgi:hypothetical protein
MLHETSFQFLNMYSISVKTEFQSYCDTSYTKSGVHQMWMLKNSKDMLEYIQSRSISACNCIKTFDLSTLYKAILHYKLKGRLKELVQSCLIKNNGQRRKHTFARKGQISVCKKTLWFVFRSPPWLGWPLWNMCVAYEYWYVPSVVNTSRSFPHVWLITRFVTRLIPRVLLVEQEQPTWVHPQILVLVTLIFSCMSIFCRLLFILLFPFLWPLCCLSSSIYRLSLWYFQTLRY